MSKILARFLRIINFLLFLYFGLFLISRRFEIFRRGTSVDITRLVGINFSRWIIPVIFLLAYILLMFNLYKKIKNLFKLRMIIYLIFSVISIAWIYIANAEPVYDQWLIYNYARNYHLWKQAIFVPFEQMYLDAYPFQLNLVFIIQLIFKIFHSTRFIILQILNLIMIVGIFEGLYQIISKRVSDKGKYVFIMSIPVCLHLLIYSTFIYGTTPGLFFGVWGIYFLLNRNHGKYNLFISAILLIISSTIKLNYQIFILVAIIVLLMDKIRIKRIIFCIILFTMPSVNGKLIEKYYQRTYGLTIDKGYSQYVWLAIGSTDAERGPGWYSNPTGLILKSEVKNVDEVSKKYSLERLEYFRNHPIYAFNFYNKKLLTLTCEPSFGSLWVNQIPNHMNNGFERIYYSVIESNLLYDMFHIQTLLIYIIFSMYLLIKKEDDQIELFNIVMLIIDGGILYHLIFEANSLYILPYYILVWTLSLFYFPNVMEKMTSFMYRIDLIRKRIRL